MAHRQPTARKATKKRKAPAKQPPKAANAGARQETARLKRELAEALERQKATGEILAAISGSRFDLQAVLDTLTQSAARLCNADMATITRQGKDGHFYHATNHNFPDDWVEYTSKFPLKPGLGSVVGRALLEKRAVLVRDVLNDPEYTFLEQQKKAGYRTFLGVPLLREGQPVGVFSLCRRTVAPFSKSQIELLSSFADQAVIAIENARLFDEVTARTDDLRESLQQQTATADVLKVISRSAFDLNSVLSTLVASAAKLCEAERGLIFLREGGQFRTAANFGFSPELEAFARANPLPADGKSTTARAGASGSPVQAVDLLADETQGHLAREYQRLGGHRTNLGVPLRRDGETIGVFTLTRQVVQAFTPRQIELVQTFADQAVIAIENSRLLEQVQTKTRDLEESLRQQTATADVLKAISRSAFDLETVLNTLIEAAAKLCEADQGTIARQQGNAFARVASWGFSKEFTALVRTVPVEPERGSATGRALLERRTVHIPNVEADPEYTFADAKRLGGFKSIVAVPMLREGNPIGVLALTRLKERPFTPRQIELVTTFADQAAIAIENVRLFESVEARTRELAASLDELRAAQDRLVQTEKLASLGQLTAGIAHEIKNPLNFINNFSALSVELIDELGGVLKPAPLDDKTREDADELARMLKGNLEKVVQHGKRADSIVKNMLLHSREGAGERRPVDINTLVGESLNLAYHGARAENQDFQLQLNQDLDPSVGEAEVLPQEITRVLLNLISNGFYAAMKRKEGNCTSSYEPALTVITRNLGDRIGIRIRDNGTGIPSDVREKIFNPFFTTKPPGEGTGLGLSMTHDIVVKQHGGRIDVETEPGAFTEFIITLPRGNGTAARPNPE